MLVTCHAWLALLMCCAAALVLAVFERGELIFILMVTIRHRIRNSKNATARSHRFPTLLNHYE